MPLAPKLAASVLVAATVATLSVLSTPAYADPAETPDDGNNVQELIDHVVWTAFTCRPVAVSNLPIVNTVEVKACVPPPTP